MVQQLVQQLLRVAGRGDPQAPQLPEDAIDNREHLYGLLCFVQREIARYEQIFNLAEEEALIDNSIYMLKSLRAQQQFLVQNLRRLEGVDNAASVEGEPVPAVLEANEQVVKEGYAMG